MHQTITLAQTTKAIQQLQVPEVCKLLEKTEQAYYRWRQKYGGMAPTMAKAMKALQQENVRLKWDRVTP